MHHLKFSAGIWIAALSALLIAGCINYEQTTTLNANGSGSMLMHYSLSQQLVAMMSMGGQQGNQGEDKTKDMPFKLKEEEVRADMKANGVKVEKFETKTEGENQHFYVTVSFDKITDLNQTKTFKEMPFEWTQKDGKIYFKQTLKGKNEAKKGEKKPEDEMAKNMAKAMFGNAAFTFKVTLPSKALPAPETNGTIADDGRTVSWTFPLVDLGDSSKDMTAVCKAGGFPMGLIALIGGAAILSLIGLIVVIVFMKKS